MLVNEAIRLGSPQEQSHNSCRNRHCPKCQSARGASRWLEARRADLLPVGYFHVVFTLPAPIAAIAYANKAVIYDVLFKAASETLLRIAADPKHLGAKIGMTRVLHSWGSTLTHHPHVHCIVPGGGFDLDGARWIAAARAIHGLVPASALFKRLLLEAAHRCARGWRVALLRRSRSSRRHRGVSSVSESLAEQAKCDWVVYAKPPFGGPAQVLKYLSRYTHRIAISNRRLLSMDDRSVTFRWKDYARRGRTQTMTLEATEFLRRFLLHIVPRGFMRIRHFGLLANAGRREHLAQARELLHVVPAATERRSERGSVRSPP